jgi:hypothetical protein
MLIYKERTYQKTQNGENPIRKGMGMNLNRRSVLSIRLMLCTDVHSFMPTQTDCFQHLMFQRPFEVWLAIDRKAWRPQIEYPPLRIMRFSGKALTEGIETHEIERVSVRIYNPAKTVADCFKYRNKIGLDVAIELMHP